MKTRSSSEFFMRRFHAVRLRKFVNFMRVTAATPILDVGGTEFDWRLLPFQPKVVLLNQQLDGAWMRVPWVIGDACRLPFADQSFPVVYSNSTTEPLFTEENQRLAASEIRRVGRGYFVQTPNRWFPVEPHYLAPLIHYLPKLWQRRLLRNFTVWGILSRPSQELCDRDVDEIRLLSVADMKTLFPDAVIIRERFLGMTKSILAVRVPS